MLYVDLRRPASHQVEGDIPVSIRETLVFLEVACYVHEEPGACVYSPAYLYLASCVILSHLNVITSILVNICLLEVLVITVRK